MSLPTLGISNETTLLQAAKLQRRDGGAAERSAAHRRVFEARLHRDLDDLQTTWRRMEVEGTMTAYQRFDWVKAISSHLVAASSASSLYVEVFDPDTKKPVMILPMVIDRRLGGRVLAWLNFGVCDYAAPICAGDFVMSKDDASLAWKAVLAVLPQFDLIDIVQIPTHVGGVANPLALLPQSQPMALTASGVELAGDPATLIRRVGGKSTEKELDKLKRRLDRRGEVRLVRATNEAEATAMFEAMLEQRRNRFRKLGRFDLLANPHVRSFYFQALRQSLCQGPVQLWGLSVGGEWVATAYNLVHAGTFHGLILTTGTEEWKNCSPGLVMVGELINRFALEGYSYFDLTIGDLPYKSGFGAKPQQLRRLLGHRTLRGWVMLRLMHAAALSKAWLEAHPRVFERLRRIRRRLRQTFSR